MSQTLIVSEEFPMGHVIVKIHTPIKREEVSSEKWVRMVTFHEIKEDMALQYTHDLNDMGRIILRYPESIKDTDIDGIVDWYWKHFGAKHEQGDHGIMRFPIPDRFSLRIWVESFGGEHPDYL